MTTNQANERELINAVADLQEERVPAIVRQRLAAGDNPFHILADCQKGMRLVGKRYGEGRYYIAGLIMAGEILRQVMDLIVPVIKNRETGHRHRGLILLGTVKEDIHDLGKNIVKLLLTCHGFTVYDLGVDVPPAVFVAEAARIKPDIVGLSGLITAAYNSMRETVALLREEAAGWDKPPHIIIGGGQLDEQVFRLVGSDYWVNEANAGVRLCKQLLDRGA